MSILRVGFDESTNKDLFKSILWKLFDNTQREALVEWPELFNDLKTDDEYERGYRMSGLSVGAEVPEGEPIPYTSPYYGGTKDWTQKAYGQGFRITHRMNKFNKYNLMKRMTKSLKVTQLELKDIYAARLWNDPTAATYTTLVGYDALAVASDSHTILASSTTYDNYGDAALAQASLESALNYFETIIDDDGRITPMRPTRLIYHPNLRADVVELLKSDGKPGEMSNTANALKEWDLTPFMYHRYTSSSSWAVLAKGDPNYDINMWTSMDPDFDMHTAYDETRDTVCNSLQYFEFGFGDPRGVYIGDV
jgi:hypothetical protein